MKEQILRELRQKVDDELKKVKQAYETTKNLVQNGDLKSDGKYDTRSTEANYLADGQRQRIAELEQEQELLQDITIKRVQKVVSIGSLITLSLNGNVREYFIAPTAGGTMLNISGVAILVISVFSPIGDAALGLSVGDSFEIELNDSIREYEVLKIQ